MSYAGDVNADGIGDLIVGAYGADPGGRDSAGASYVVFGTETGFAPVIELSSLDGTNGFRIEGIKGGHNDVSDLSGHAVSAAGDVNGDGVNDLIIGAVGADPGGRIDAGESYILFGRSSAVIDGTDASDRLRGDVARNRIEGMAGNDRLEGGGNDDTLLGGDGRDQLLGGDGADTIDGGTGRDILFGGNDADVFVLAETDTFDLIQDFSLAESDQVRITIAEVTDQAGEVDADLVHAVDSGTSLLIQVDQDFAAGNGFQADTIATLSSAAGLDLAQILEHGLF